MNFEFYLPISPPKKIGIPQFLKMIGIELIYILIVIILNFETNLSISPEELLSGIPQFDGISNVVCLEEKENEFLFCIRDVILLQADDCRNSNQWGVLSIDQMLSCFLFL